MKTTIEELKETLNHGFCLFSYEKVNGDLRLAIGTTNGVYISNVMRQLGIEKKDSRKERTECESTTTYFDLSRMDFRRFRNENVKEIYAWSMPFETAAAYSMAIIVAFSEFDGDDMDYAAQKLYGMCNERERVWVDFNDILSNHTHLIDVDDNYATKDIPNAVLELCQKLENDFKVKKFAPLISSYDYMDGGEREMVSQTNVEPITIKEEPKVAEPIVEKVTKTETPIDPLRYDMAKAVVSGNAKVHGVSNEEYAKMVVSIADSILAELKK